MKTLTTLDMVVIEEYYQMTTMGNMNWMKRTHLLPISFLQNLGPLSYNYLYLKSLKSLLKHTLEKMHTSPSRILSMISRDKKKYNIPSYPHISSYMVS